MRLRITGGRDRKRDSVEIFNVMSCAILAFLPVLRSLGGLVTCEVEDTINAYLFVLGGKARERGLSCLLQAITPTGNRASSVAGQSLWQLKVAMEFCW